LIVDGSFFATNDTKFNEKHERNFVIFAFFRVIRGSKFVADFLPRRSRNLRKNTKNNFVIFAFFRVLRGSKFVFIRG